MSEAVRNLTGKELRKLYDGLSDNGREKLANLALNLKHIPAPERPDLSALVREWKITRAKLRLDLLTREDDSDEASDAICEKTWERQREIERVLATTLPRNYDEIMHVIALAIQKIEIAHEEGEEADHPATACGMLTYARLAALKLLDPRHKDEWIEGEDGSRQLRPPL